MSSIDHIVNELRAIALDLKEGDFIGTEEALTRRFGVSGPTLRKAIRQLEHEEVVAVRRGVRGGFFSHRPKLDTVIRVAGIYLGGHEGSIDDVPELVEALTPILVDSALRSPRLGELAPFAEPRDELLPHDQFIREVFAFATTLYDIAGNLPLRLCLSIFFRVGISVVIEERGGSDDAGQLLLQQTQSRFARALLDGDREAAIGHYRTISRLVFAGIKRSLEVQREARSR
jgi:DNA-binding FadR family transcriptional regulator